VELLFLEVEDLLRGVEDLFFAGRPVLRDVFFAAFFAVFFAGTLAPFFRASDKPIAIACFRLFTFLPDRPDVKDPFFFLRIALATVRWAFFEYLAITFVLMRPKKSRPQKCTKKSKRYEMDVCIKHVSSALTLNYR
jgi:hypothetical protein